MKDFILKGLVSGGYIGHLPRLKGTLGTLEAVTIYLLLFNNINCPHKEYIISGIGIAFFTGFCLLSGKWAENYYKTKDPPYFVADEIAGYFLSVFMLDITKAPFSIIIFTFITFRLLDIIKPFPANKSEKLSGGFGIVADDLIVGIYTNILAQIVIATPWFIKLDQSISLWYR